MPKKSKAASTTPRSSGQAAPPKRRPSLRASRVNKHGQALGRKGSETRQRLMDAARRLLVDQSPMELTAVSIASEAQASSATFYIYFDDVREIIYALSDDAGAGFSEVHRILEEDWDPETLDLSHAQRVVDAFNDVWDRHRDILRFRNLEADRGDREFLDLRVRSSVRIIDRFVDRILAAHPKEQRPPRGEAYAEATALFAAMEGLAETDPLVVEEWRIGATRLRQATAKLLARSFGAPQGGRPRATEPAVVEPAPRKAAAAPTAAPTKAAPRKRAARQAA